MCIENLHLLSHPYREYLARKNMWNKKSSPSDPKKKKLVKSRQTSSSS